MPSSGSSRRGSRRSSPSPAPLLLWLFFAAATAAPAQGALLSAFLEDEAAVVSLTMVETSGKQLVRSAYDGQSAGVSFDLRIYRYGSGPGGLFGDRILLEREIEKTGGWNAFTGRFEITCSDGSQWTGARAEEYTRQLLSLDGYAIPGVWDRGDAYLLARVRLKSVLLEVPFNLLDPFLPETRTMTPWVRWDFRFGADEP